MKTRKVTAAIQIVCISLLINNLSFCQGANSTPPSDQGKGKKDAVSGDMAGDNDQSQLYQSLSLAVLADPNAVIQATEKFSDLKMALAKIHRTGMSEWNVWASRRGATYRPVISIVHRQLKDELDLIASFAAAEDANATKAASKEMLVRWNKRFVLIGEQMRQLRREQRQGSRVMQPRRMRGRYGETNQNKKVEPPKAATKETDYDVSPWLVANMDNCKELSQSMNDELMVDFGKILSIAKKEKVEKTTLAVEAIIVDRGQRFNELQKVYDRDEPGKSMTTPGRNPRLPGGNRGVNNEASRPGARRYR